MIQDHVNAHSQTIKLFECNQLSSIQLESIHGLATSVWGLTPSPPSSFTKITATGNRSLHTPCWPLVPAESQEKAWWFRVTMSSRCWWGHCNVQGKLCAVALHHTLETSKQLPHVISHTRVSLSSSWLVDVSREEWNEKCAARANIFM